MTEKIDKSKDIDNDGDRFFRQILTQKEENNQKDQIIQWEELQKEKEKEKFLCKDPAFPAKPVAK